ncbi:poly-beta-1,6-N-acetyl-D-glucosamine biosynthesis protein PgaD [Alcaligenaceae bacterium CGII-47]|nr:poly-beta-1,6-N-acetyl-D-glucosamine biosynthesis protein PgaD [Alcaligenaceae bacterium CGII-47]
MMLITTPRSKAAALIDFLLTLLAWLAFSYLFVVGLIAFLMGDALGTAVPSTLRWLPTIYTFIFYVVMVASIAAVLFSWAQYNTLRFGRSDRRIMYPILRPEELANSCGISMSQLEILRSSQRVVIYHTDDGLIRMIDIDDETITHPKIRIVG